MNSAQIFLTADYADITDNHLISVICVIRG
jgi:hypothetical protein